MLEKGTTLGGYRIDGVIGQGGMGVVYEATQLSLMRTVALKVVAPDLSGDVAFRERFRREGLLQAQMEHPHIITVHEAGESEHGLFLAMRLVRGPSLKDLIVARELDPARSLRLVGQVADALETAHEAGLIHRDIKPQNILVGARDHAYLADFGLTKAPGGTSLTTTGHFVGTIDYVSPEQIRGEAASNRSDIYSLGAVLYECLTGVVPFPKDSQAAVLYAHLSQPPPRVTERRDELPSALDDVIATAMAKEPADRYASGGELMRAAERAFDEVPANLPAPGPIARPEEAGIRPAEEEVSTERPEGLDGGAAVSGPLGAPAEASAAPASTPTTTRVAAETAKSPPPTGVLPGDARPAAVGAPSRARRSRRLAGMAAGVIAVTALAGFLLGASGSEKAAPAARSSASAGGLELGFPDDWERAGRAPTVPGIRFRSPIAVRPRAESERGGPADAGLVAGLVTATGPSLLPATFLDRLDRAPPRGDPVRLGKLEAYRYDGLRPKGFDRALTLYVVPTTRGVATVACYAPRQQADSFLPACESVAANLTLVAGRPYGLGPSREHASAVGRAIGELNSSMRAARDRLRRARTPDGQAQAALELSAAYARAARSLSGLRVSPALVDANRRIVRALRATQAAYERMGSGARGDDRVAYDAGARAARRGEEALRRALDGLKALGYS